MPGEVSTEAAFTEVLELTVDSGNFAEQMDRIVAIYKAALAKMGESEGFGGYALSASVDKLNSVIEKMTTGTGEALGDLATYMTESTDSMQTAFAQTAASIQESQEKIVEAINASKNAIRGAGDGAGSAGSSGGGSRSRSGDSDYIRDLKKNSNVMAKAQQSRDMEERLTEVKAEAAAEAQVEEEKSAQIAEIRKNSTAMAKADQARDLEAAIARGKEMAEAEKTAAAEAAEASKAAAAEKEIQQKRDLENAIASGRAMASADKAAATESAEASREAAAQKAIQEKRDLDAAVLRGKQMAAADKAASAESVEATKEASAEKAIQEKRDLENAIATGKAMAAADKALAAEQIANAKEVSRIKEIQQKRDMEAYEAANAGDKSGLASFMEKFTKDIGGSAGSLAKTYLIWTSINALIEATTATIAAPFKAVAEGMKYLDDVQERASEVKAALLQSVSYSSDWGRNVEIAGQQADSLVRKIDDIAVKLKVSSQSVQTGFTSFLEYGGRNLTGSVDDALKLSGLVTGALQTQTPQMDSRKIMGEMQKLVQGSAQDSDKLAAALGLSKDQLKEMVDHAAKYHDLLQEIEAKVPGITERIGEANNRQGALLATLELYKDRWEGLIAGPLFDQFTKILQNILAWVDKNSDRLTQMGKDLGAALGQAAQAAEAFVKNNWSEVADTFRVIAKLVVGIGSTIAQVVNDTMTLVELGNTAGARLKRDRENSDISHARTEHYGGRLLKHPGFWSSPAEIDAQKKDQVDYDKQESEAYARVNDEYNQNSKPASQIFSKYAQNGKAIDDAANKLLSQIDSFGKNPGTKEALDPAGAPEHPITQRHPKEAKPKWDDSELRQAQRDLQDDITKTKNAYQAESDAIKDALAKNTINHKTAAAETANLTGREQAALESLIKTYKSAAMQSGAKPEAIKAAVDAMQHELDTFKGQAAHTNAEAQKAADAESEDVAKQHYTNLLALEQQHQKQRLEMARQAQADGRMTPVQTFDVESIVQGQEQAQGIGLARDEADRYADGTKAKEAALGKLQQLEDAYTANVRLRTEQRIALVEKEAQTNFQHGIDAQTNQGAFASTTRNIRNMGIAPDRSGAEQAQAALTSRITTETLLNTAALLANARAKNANSEATLKLENDLAKLQNTRLQQFGENVQRSIQSAGTNTGLGQVLGKQSADSQMSQVAVEIRALTQELERAQAKSGNDFKTGNVGALSGDAAKTNALQAQITALTADLKGMQDASSGLGLSFKSAGQSLMDSLLGPGFLDKIEKQKEAFDDATSSTDKMTDAVGIAATGLQALDNIGQTIENSIKQYSNAKKEGGVLGGVGSLMSSGPLSDALSAIPVVGSIVKPLGAAFQMIGDMFVQQAKNIANQIEKQVTAINNAYSDGQATISTTITALQQQRAQAVAQLSGVKGGQDQLNQLLPNLDQEIAQLEQTAKNTTKAFEDTVLQLQSGNTELASWIKSWQDINKQVADYLAAGGDIATANQYLNEQLQQQRLQLTDSLNQGESQAIQDAINLNNLIQQRIDLEKQEAETEFGIENANAIEKRTSVGVQVASQLKDQRQSYNEQLDDLNYQITATTEKLSLEKQVFNIASDTATLQAQSNTLTLASLQEQLSTYEEMAQLLQSTNGLSFTGTTFNGGIPGTNISGTSGIGGVTALTLNVTVNANGQNVNGQQFATYLAQSISAQVTANRTTV